MSENSQDDKYKIPKEIVLKTRLNDNFEWVTQNGIPSIKTVHDITFHEDTGDYVTSLELFNLTNNNLVIRCKLPEICNEIDNLYIGGSLYYCQLLGCNTIQAFGPGHCDISGTQSYSQWATYTQVYDGTYVKFKINGCTFASFALPNDIKNDRLWFGFSEVGPQCRHVSIHGIDTYVSGVRGADGIDGNTILYMQGIPCTWVGTSGDFYLNDLSGALYGRKNGLCGSLFFDGIHGSNTSLVIANDEDLRMRSENFTIEWFQYMTDDVYGRIFSMYNYGEGNNSGYAISIENSDTYNVGQTLYFYANDNLYELQFQNYESRWIHIAVTRCGDELHLFIDGDHQSSVNFNEDINNTTSDFVIGNLADPTETGDYKGYITNFRLIKGRAIYQEVYDIPLEPLTDVADTKLLITASTYTNAFIDSSSKAKVITNNNVMWDPITPFESKGVWNPDFAPLKLFDPVR